MRIQPKLQAALTGVAVLALSSMAHAIDKKQETEYNHPVDRAQALTSVGVNVTAVGVEVSADIGIQASVPDDVDYYTFNARQGDVVTIAASSYTGLSTTLALFSPPLEQASGEIVRIDQKVGTGLDTVIEKLKLDYTGTYTVAVTNAPRTFEETGGGIDWSNPDSGMFGEYFQGPYTLTVTAAEIGPADPIPVSLVVNPMGDGPKKLNPNANYLIPVAILSDSDFNAGTIDQESVTFGATGSEDSLTKCDPILRDIKGDGAPLDLVCYFENRQAGWTGTEEKALMKGQTTQDTGSVMFEGSAKVDMVSAR